MKILVLMVFIFNSFLFGLTNEMLADKHLIAAKKYVKAKEYKKAVDNFEKIFDLGVKVPNDIYYFYAKTLKNNHQLEKSLKNFDLYVKKTGRSSQHYQETLGYMVDIEETIAIKQKQRDIKNKKREEELKNQADIKRKKETFTTNRYDYNKKKNYVIAKLNFYGDGIQTLYFTNGVLLSKQNMRAYKKHGETLFYYKSGKIESKDMYIKGKLEGKSLDYYEDGPIRIVSNYKNGKREGKFTSYYKDGTISTESYYKKGEENGSYKKYHKNGNRKMTGYYKNGKERGTWRYYDKRGKFEWDEKY